MKRIMIITALVIVLAVALMLIVSATSIERAEAAEESFILEPAFTPAPTPEPGPPEHVYLLAKIMMAEAGVDWPDWATMLIGEVVLNRVASPHFPGSVRGVLYQRDGNQIQYAPVWEASWDTLEPDARHLELAQRLIDGERPIGNPDMIWQALFRQGEQTLVSYYDPVLDSTTYFCAN